MKKRRLAFTLMEVLLSLTLFGLLLNTLYFWYTHLAGTQGALRTTHEALLEERYAQQQLASILPKANLAPFFFTSLGKDRQIDGNSLVFTFDYGPHADPLLSSTVLGRLFIDKESQTLCLGIWPHPHKKTREPSKTLILLGGVSNLEFSFYYPSDPFRMPVDPKEVGNKTPEVEGWNSTWKQSYELLPPLMKLKFQRTTSKGQYPLEFAFDLPLSSKRIVYKQ